MTLSLILLTGLMAGLVFWLFRQSVNVRPWQATSGRSGLVELPPRAINQRRVALATFAAVVLSFFALFISAYLMRMHFPDWQSLPKPRLLWLNTGMLVLGSAALQFASGAAVRGEVTGTRNGLIAGGVFTLAFIAGQVVVWRELQAAGHGVSINPANAFFYLLTALHALHMFGGLVAWSRPTLLLVRGANVAGLRSSVELCTWYWHLLLVVWLVLFSVLLAT
jgi:cytochrome c oxidase subunit 3